MNGMSSCFRRSRTSFLRLKQGLLMIMVVPGGGVDLKKSVPYGCVTTFQPIERMFFTDCISGSGNGSQMTASRGTYGSMRCQPSSGVYHSSFVRDMSKKGFPVRFRRGDFFFANADFLGFIYQTTKKQEYETWPTFFIKSKTRKKAHRLTRNTAFDDHAFLFFFEKKARFQSVLIFIHFGLPTATLATYCRIEPNKAVC